MRMYSKRMLVWCVVLVVLLTMTLADPGHPQRPDKFANEEQLRKYLRELKQYYEDNVRIGRFGKRNYQAPAMFLKSYPKQADPEWKTEYDYYTQFNI